MPKSKRRSQQMLEAAMEEHKGQKEVFLKKAEGGYILRFTEGYGMGEEMVFPSLSEAQKKIDKLLEE